MNETDPFSHFLLAQAGVYEQVLSELSRGRKSSYWMWFTFPQLKGLGRSDTSRRYALDSVEDARRYLHHPVLGARLLQCCRLLLALPINDPVAIFGSIDAVKLRSSMTLFALASPDMDCFREILGRFFRGEPDPLTLEMTAS